MRNLFRVFLEAYNIHSFLKIEFGKNHENRDFLTKKQGYNSLTFFAFFAQNFFLFKNAFSYQKFNENEKPVPHVFRVEQHRFIPHN